ncbi:hypothetical protein LZK82_03020 [Rhizobium leguminosarum]|nr:hypothetical protein LZK82_03020 [Rhizobium leguminosarum]UIK11431.1 hypothetical protein LZK80_03010 [Rhizobium leguminosarum]UIL28483.1 hypothetical protein LZK75_03015 [Rhizobium leguminosarum]
MDIPNERSFAEEAYERDRASDAECYCKYLTSVIALTEELQEAVSREEQQETMALLSKFKAALQCWPTYDYLDVTEESVERLVQYLLLNLDIEGPQLFSIQSKAGVSHVLKTLQDAYLEADQYQESTDD